MMQSKESDDKLQISSLMSDISRLNLETHELSESLNSTRVERDDTVSDMRQDIERLQLLHSDQSQLVQRAEQSENSLKILSEKFQMDMASVQIERDEFASRLLSLNYLFYKYLITFVYILSTFLKFKVGLYENGAR